MAAPTPIDTVSAETRASYARLRERLESYESLMVAYSGGVDSGLLAHVAYDVLGDRMLAVIGISGSLPAREEAAAIEFLESHGIPYERVDTQEMQDERYRRNNPDRCYFCKAELFTRLHAIAGDLGYEKIAYGANVDDRSDHRPGAAAADEQRVVAPLSDAGLTKSRIRELARAFGLTLWDKPAAPCLASRIPYYSEVTPAKLRQIERAEDALKDLGFSVCRVRHRGAEARVEVPLEDHDRVRAVWSDLSGRIRESGFETVVLEPTGFRSGRLNDALGPSSIRRPARSSRQSPLTRRGNGGTMGEESRDDH